MKVIARNVLYARSDTFCDERNCSEITRVFGRHEYDPSKEKDGQLTSSGTTREGDKA